MVFSVTYFQFSGVTQTFSVALETLIHHSWALSYGVMTAALMTGQHLGKGLSGT